ncbi:MAG: hypothetical protein ACE5EX_02420, partial [Phycisphaerae bacterium]
MSLLSAEGGVATTAYLFAYALCLERGTWQAKLRSLWPYAAVVVVWRMLWVRLGYGVSGVGGYVDPLAEPLRFLHALIDRAPIYLLGQWAMPSADIAVMDNAVLTRWVWRGAVVFLAERERWALWLPAMLGLGISLYFLLPLEPPGWIGTTG